MLEIKPQVRGKRCGRKPFEQLFGVGQASSGQWEIWSSGFRMPGISVRKISLSAWWGDGDAGGNFFHRQIESLPVERNPKGDNSTIAPELMAF